METPIIRWGRADNTRRFIMPLQATKLSAAHDLYLPEDLLVSPGFLSYVDLNLVCCMPEDYYCNIYIRSGVGFKYGVTLANSVAVIDSDYYNEWHLCVTMLAHPDKDTDSRRGNDVGRSRGWYKFLAGERIAQAVFQKKPEYEVDTFIYSAKEIQLIVEERDSERSGGLGHTGK